jgi:hypothetical protein
MEEHIWYQVCYTEPYNPVTAERFVGKVRNMPETEEVHVPPPQPTYSCRKCRNKNRFLLEDGDVTCLECGLVATGVVDLGNPYRKLPDKEDREHFGEPYDPRFSYSYNHRTYCADEEDRGFMTKVDTADGYGMTTRDSFRDADKEDAFRRIRDVGCNLTLHAKVIERAILLYCKYRNVREKLQNRNEIMFAALVLALREVHAPAQVFMKVERPAKAVASLPPLNTWTQDMGEAWLEREVAPRYPGEWVKPFSAALLKGFDEDDMGRRLLLSNERALAKCLGPQAPPGLAKCIFEAVRVLKG